MPFFILVNAMNNVDCSTQVSGKIETEATSASRSGVMSRSQERSSWLAKLSWRVSTRSLLPLSSLHSKQIIGSPALLMTVPHTALGHVLNSFSPI